MVAAGRILIIEDEENIRTGLQQLLESEGYRVSTACDGVEGLKAARGTPDLNLILLDLMMPIMDGRQFLVEKGQDQDIADLPVVVLTAGNDQVSSKDIRAVMRKPFNIDRLLETIQKHLIA
jgi:CheY-like chemotaxis protein